MRCGHYLTDNTCAVCIHNKVKALKAEIERLEREVRYLLQLIGETPADLD